MAGKQNRSYGDSILESVWVDQLHVVEMLLKHGILFY